MSTQNDFLSTFPTEDEAVNIAAAINGQVKGYREGAELRMQNYYNCIDDYSYGGLCDQATSSIIRNADEKLSILREQMVKGAPLTMTESVNVLIDLSTGNICTDRTVVGKFGLCWIIGSGDDVKFVGCAKKAKTYESKGYAVKTMVYEVEYFIKNSGGMSARVISETLQDYDFSIELMTYKSEVLSIALK